MSKELTATAIARLYLIHNEQRTRLIACLAGSVQELCRCHTDTAYTLNRLDNNGGILLARKFALKSLHVVKIDEGNIRSLIGRGLDCGVIRQRHSHTCATVECAVHSQHAGTTRCERSQLNGILVSLRTTIAEEEFVVGVARQGTQLLGQLYLQGVDNGIGIEAYF